MDAQEMHDLEMSQRAQVSPESKGRLQALLAKKSASSSRDKRFTAYDPIEVAMAIYPGLTRERAEEMARNLGF
jgi:hypothetical protein